MQSSLRRKRLDNGRLLLIDRDGLVFSGDTPGHLLLACHGCGGDMTRERATAEVCSPCAKGAALQEAKKVRQPWQVRAA